ncbi:MAG TPA: hypothetical protein VGK94_08615 [Candidatus Polarisedimenticolia bacterium]|jgi:hypothetical protein
MLSMLKRPAVAAAIFTLSPLALLLSGGASDAQAHTYVSGEIVIGGGPAAVVGYSYGNPYLYGHVHYSPAYCSRGPIYYYPRQGVYAHYYPRYQYYPYARPVIHRVARPRIPLPPHVQFLRNRLRTHAQHLRGHWGHDD